MSIRRVLLAAVAVLCCTLPLAAAAGAAPTPGSSPTARIGDVSARPGVVRFTFAAGNLPAGSTLDPDSVVVTAGGRQLPATASPADAARNPRATAAREVVLALDVSGSMKGAGIAAARSAAISYVRSLPADVRVGLLTFATHAALRVRPTTDRAALTKGISAVRAGGSTALYDGIVAAAAVMDALPADATRRMVILSDGDDTSSSHSLTQALAALAKDKIAADVVGFRLPGNERVLDRIASNSGGTSLPARSVGDLAGAFSRAAAAFQQQLLVTVRIPHSLSGHTETLLAAVDAGTQALTAHRRIHLPAGIAARVAPQQRASQPVGSAADNTRLLATLAAVFLALFVVLLYALLAPVLHGEQVRKQARLAEMNRYRVLGAIGIDAAAPANAPGPELASALTRATLATVARAVRAGGRREGVVEELDRAGLRMRPEEWVVLQLAAAAVGAALFGLPLGLLGVLAGAVLGYAAVRVFIRTRISRRLNSFVDQLPDTLQLIAGALRTGFSLNQALAGVVREGTEPAASEFARTLAEVRLGTDLEDALDNTADRMRCEDLHWVVLAVRISREVGGNLAEVVTTTMRTMRQRAELRGQVRVLSAEGRISARILTALPFVAACAMLLFRRDYLAPLVNQGIGIAMIVGGVLLLCLGTFWLSRLVKIKV